MLKQSGNAIVCLTTEKRCAQSRGVTQVCVCAR